MSDSLIISESRIISAGLNVSAQGASLVSSAFPPTQNMAVLYVLQRYGQWIVPYVKPHSTGLDDAGSMNILLLSVALDEGGIAYAP